VQVSALSYWPQYPYYIISRPTFSGSAQIGDPCTCAGTVQWTGAGPQCVA
jgi:hypothetical protein